MAKVKDIVGALFSPPTDPRVCPICRRYPKLVVGDHFSHYECKKWFGLKMCFRGPSVVEGRDDGEWAQRAAARAWNQKIEVYERVKANGNR